MCENHPCLCACYACVRGVIRQSTHAYVSHEKHIVILHIAGILKEKQTNNYQEEWFDAMWLKRECNLMKWEYYLINN